MIIKDQQHRILEVYPSGSRQGDTIRITRSTLQDDHQTTPLVARIPYVAGLLALLVFVLYFPVRSFDFVQYDDNDYVFDNPTVRAGLSWWGLVWSFVDAHSLNWHPITWLSHMLDCQLFGLNPGAHHLVNVLLHCINSALLLILLRRMTGAVWRSALVAGLFALHPLRVESVAWISERKDLLSGLFFMLTLLAYARYAEEAGDRKPQQGDGRRKLIVQSPRSKVQTRRPVFASTRSRYYALSIAFFVLGLLSKPMLVSVPFILLLLDFWPLNRFHPRPHSCNTFLGNFFNSSRQLAREKIPFLLLSLTVGVITFLSQRAGGAVVSLKSEGIFSRLATAITSYYGYLVKFFWPRDLSVLYLRPDVDVARVAIIVGGALVLVSLFGLALYPLLCALGNPKLVISEDQAVESSQSQNANRKWALPIGWLWFVIMLFPVCGLVQVGPQFMADRYTYLPSIGLGLILAWCLPNLVVQDETRRNTKHRRPIPYFLRLSLHALALSALLSCVIVTHHQLSFWRNTETLMTHALALDPNNYIAHQDLAVYYAKLGKTDLARAHRQRVRELDPELRKTTSFSAEDGK